MFSIYRISFRQLVEMPHLWLMNLAVILSNEMSPSFAELFTFEKTEVAVIDTVQGTLFLAILISSLASSYTLLGRELYGKISLQIFTKPISRQQFITEKSLALITVLTLTCLLQGLWVLKQGLYLHWSTLGLSTALHCLYAIYLQGLLITALAIFATIAIGQLAGAVFPIAMVILSYAIPKSIANSISFIIPPFPQFDLSPLLYSGTAAGSGYMFFLSAYTAAYFFALLILSGIILYIKEY